jgi:non-ribosomal peptide synthetase component F
MTLLSGFQALLYSYTAQERINVGTFIANRNRAEIEPLIGFFVNNLVLSTDLSGDPSFRELLKRVRTVALDAYAHQDLPFEKLLEELNPVRDPSYSPLFQVMFVMQNLQMAVRPTGLTLSPLGPSSQRANFDLTLWMWETTEGFRGSMEYNTDLFEEATVNELVEQYQDLMKQFLQDPDKPLSETPVLQQLLSVYTDPFLI